MSTNGHHASPETGHKRRNLLMIGAIVVALLVFGGGYAIGRSNNATESASPSLAPSPTTTHTHIPETQPEPERDAERERVTQRERVRGPEPDGRATR